MTALELVVYGTPVPAGSKRAFTRPGGRVGVADTSGKRGKDWRASIQHVAGDTMTGRELLRGPLRVHITFVVPRPAGHFGARGIRPSAPAYPTVRPDVLKLARAVEDALTGIVWNDDSQIVEETLTKHYGEPARVVVTIHDLTAAAAA